MSGFGLHVEESATRLVVTDPFGYSALFAVLFVTYVLYASRKKGSVLQTRNVVHLVIGLVVWMSGLSTSRVVLDRSAGTATLAEFRFLHWSQQTLPLKDVVRARVRTGSTTGALQLQLASGHMYRLSGMNQMGGKDEAAFAINRFLGAEPTS